MIDASARHHAAHDYCRDGAVQPGDAPGGVSEAVFNAALCGWVKGTLLRPERG